MICTHKQHKMRYVHRAYFTNFIRFDAKRCVCCYVYLTLQKAVVYALRWNGKQYWYLYDDHVLSFIFFPFSSSARFLLFFCFGVFALFITWVGTRVLRNLTLVNVSSQWRIHISLAFTLAWFTQEWLHLSFFFCVLPLLREWRKKVPILSFFSFVRSLFNFSKEEKKSFELLFHVLVISFSSIAICKIRKKRVQKT